MISNLDHVMSANSYVRLRRNVAALPSSSICTMYIRTLYNAYMVCERVFRRYTHHIRQNIALLPLRMQRFSKCIHKRFSGDTLNSNKICM